MYVDDFKRIEEKVAVGETTGVAKMTTCGTIRKDHREVTGRGGYDGYFIVCATRPQGRYIQVIKNSENSKLEMYEFEVN